ncbi:MAG: hypothetical protein IPK58_23555 [Acidobacteria bacterium]|nr:hypothetical protein [Acidobacteriota bacterium]
MLTAILLMVLNVAAHIAYMIIFGMIINPGNEPVFYEEHARSTAPYSAIIAGFPLTFVAARLLAAWVGRDDAMRAALSMWAIYFGADLLIVASSGSFTAIAPFFAVSFSTKLLAAYLGVLVYRRSA